MKKQTDMKKTIASSCLFMIGVIAVHGQWCADPSQNTRLVEPAVRGYEISSAGNGWFLAYDSPAAGSSAQDSVNPHLQYYLPDGDPAWESPIEIARHRSLPTGFVHQRLLVDKEGNALVIAQDLRADGGISGKTVYAAYRVSSEGVHLWNPEGVELHGGHLPGFCAALRMIQLEDGSFIFAWVESEEGENIDFIRMQRVSAQGEILWGTGKTLREDGVMVSYPALVSAGNNEYLLAYTRGSDLFVQKFDFDGNAVWPEPTQVFSGTLPNVPAYTFLDARKAGDGILLAFHAGNGPTYPYCAYIRSDGSHAFGEGDAGLRLGYSERNATNVKLCIDTSAGVAYAVWREYHSQDMLGYYGLVAQKISLDGELLWNPEGLEIVPLSTCGIDDWQISMGPKNTVMVVYNQWAENGDFDDQRILAVLFTPEGEPAWEAHAFFFFFSIIKTRLQAIRSGDQWIAAWQDCRDFDDNIRSNIYAQNLDASGSIGPETGTESGMSQMSVHPSIVPNPVSGHCKIRFVSETGVDCLRVDVYSLRGALVSSLYEGPCRAGLHVLEWNRPDGLPAGMYILRISAGHKISDTKILVL